ncbi:DUF5047 domain-containing protein [Actinoplanes palleronii]|uniref:DUF5047 domain-containing protein n=1 Tax=Actinoplanes palleronii TaxID=113570 RepID=A0ABQ4BJ83_9ACTN|nr:DUF5047 domain-containing protein [Actinoplanes palleronii]GIE70724.1 hypothetical protein Apa02nite_068320 [Actinoplanes palleronii]
MYPVSSTFGQALRESHTVAVRVDAYLGGSLIASDMPISGGSVSVAGGTGVRRTLDLTIADRALWSTLDTIGVELRPYRGIRYPSGDKELVPLGVFSLDSQSISVGPSGGISVKSAPDRWARVQRAQFEQPTASVPTAQIRAEISRLVTGAVSGITVSTTATSISTVGPIVWDQDRAAAAVDLATSIGAEVYFDVAGNLRIADAPLLGQTPVWTVDASPSGVLLSGERTRDRQRTYNVVVAYPSSLSGSAPYAPVIAADTDPTSRTYVGGPFGRVPYRYTSPAMTSSAQALVAAKALLNRVKAINAQLSVEAIVHPGLDRGDVITVLTPGGTTELHLIDSLTIPLDIGGTQQIITRSSRPDGDVPTGE